MIFEDKQCYINIFYDEGDVVAVAKWNDKKEGEQFIITQKAIKSLKFNSFKIPKFVSSALKDIVNAVGYYWLYTCTLNEYRMTKGA